MDRLKTERDLATVLQQLGLSLAPNAMVPLSRIDFGKLVAIHDHEERFLRTVFIDSLVTAHQARLAAGEGGHEVTHQDIRTAMLMLGTAAAAAPEPQFSTPSKSIVKEACPYCAQVQSGRA